MLPAGHGDCILIEYGDPPRRILVDGGPARCYPAIAARLGRVPRSERRVDLLVITHVDADHVEGAVKLLNDADLAVEIGEVWFNGYRHLPPDDVLGPPQGEMVSALLQERGVPWNARFGGAPVRRPADRPPTRVELPDGMVLTVLAPGDAQLKALRPVWEKECDRAGLTPGSTREALDLLAGTKRLDPLDSYLGDTGPDHLDVTALAAQPQTGRDDSAANASSIVLLAEYAGRSVLLAGDAVPAALTAGLEHLLAERDQPVLDVDAFKLPHHGSRYNVTREVLDLVRARTYLVSTDGRYFGHPDAAALARVVVGGPAGRRVVFNYRSPTTVVWRTATLPAGRETDFGYPAQGHEGAVVAL